MKTEIDSCHLLMSKADEPCPRELEPRLRRSAKLPPEIREPYFHDDSGLWLLGNIRLIDAKLACIEGFGEYPNEYELYQVELLAQEIVLDGTTLVCGVHNAAHKRAATVPLRWGAPRIVVLSGGFRYHLGKDLDHEPFAEARLWRYQWDPLSDLAISRRAPFKLPTYAHQNGSVDNLIRSIVSGEAWLPINKSMEISQQSLFA